MSGRFKWFVVKKASFFLGISKKNNRADELVHLFNKGLKSMRHDGTYDSIHDKYR